MNKMEILVFKLKEDIAFPYQKLNVNMGNYTNKLKYNDYLGLVYKDSSRKIREIGILAKVVGFMSHKRFSTQSLNSVSSTYVTLDVLGRIKILDHKKVNDITSDSELFVGPVQILEDEIITTEVKNKIHKEMLFEKLKAEANKFFVFNNIQLDFMSEFNYVKYVWLICPFLKLVGEEKQRLLEINDLYSRMSEVLKLIKTRGELQGRSREKEGVINTLAKPSQGKGSKVPEKFRDSQGSGKLSNVEDFENKINTMNLPEEAKKIATEELEKLKQAQGQSNPESEWIFNYLKIFLNLPWDKTTVDNEDINKTKTILDRDHFGLNKVKKRIIEYLSVRKLNAQNTKGSILCFNGPPGVGKTSLAKSIAESLGKKFYRLSLGGVRDESEIRGHRRTYIASMPGMIIQALNRVQTKNPVILLDEIDKVGTHFKGDVSSSLLEVLDPEQNSTFKDHFINTPFDLSQVFFICTSNYLENVSPPLRDRLEVIDIPGYTIQEKIQICKKYLIPKQIKEKGLDSKNVKIEVKFSDDIIESMIVDYSFESGVRQLERNVASVCRYIARVVVEEMDTIAATTNTKPPVNKELETLNETKTETTVLEAKSKFEKTFEINEAILKEVLGRKMSNIDLELRTSHPGVAIGLAYTLNGGAITLIESTLFRGKGDIIITGNMGDIMKESVSTGLSWIKSNTDFLGLTDFDFTDKSLHIHVPQAAVPKDGPSAGITICLSIISLLKSTLIRKDTAMTGEITLQGYVLPVGGIKEKCLAAVRNKIKRVILSAMNKHDVDELSQETKNSLEFIFVTDIKEVILNAFNGDILKDTKSSIRPKF